MELYMRTWYWLPFFLMLPLMSLAQESPSSQGTSNDNSAGNGAPVTVEGCVTSINGYFTLVTPDGAIRLKGDHDALFGHNGQQVRITGTLTKKKGSQVLRIASLKKVSDTCQY
jgi:hypothetical protein